jgi:hypothetical protein
VSIGLGVDGGEMAIRAWGSISSWRLATCGGLVAIADHFFYGHDIGWTLGLFCFLLLAVSALYSLSGSRQAGRCSRSALDFAPCWSRR